MPSSSDPEKYSIDEMMERLQNRPGEDPTIDGELVTRADGSQAVKVRKHKRRTRQSHKEGLAHIRRSRMIQISASLVLVLGAVFVCGIAIIYANSSPFREGLINKIAGRTGAKVDLSEFRMTPTRAMAGKLNLSWPEGNAISKISARGFSAEISPSSFLGKSMMGQDVSSSDVTLALRIPDPDKPALLPKATTASSSIDFKSYYTPNLHVLLGDPMAALARLEGTDASFQATNDKGVPQLLLNRGDVIIPGWPKLKIDRAHIEFRGTAVDVVGMRLHHENDALGVFELSGTLSPYSRDRASVLAVQLQSFPLAGIAGPEWGQLFQGRIDSKFLAKSNFLSITSGEVLESLLVISFSNSLTSSFTVRGFPFLFGLGQILNDDWFEKPVFDDDVKGVIRREHDNIRFENLDFISKGRLALRGSLLTTADGKLSGNLKVGLGEAMIGASKNRKLDAMFGPANEGFRWLTLDISGSRTSPLDNFRALYEAAVPEPEARKDDGIPSFEDLTPAGRGN